MKEYKITVKRGKTEGTLSYSGTSTDVSTTCWWDRNKKIPAGTYRNCSATTMANKQNSKGLPREGIYIPDVMGFSEIFIHMGINSSWSKGCIVISEEKLLAIYNDIVPKNGRNVIVNITNSR